jgi:cell division protein FtsL
MEASMTDRQVRSALPSRLFLFALLAGGLFYLGLSFVQQASVNRQRRLELNHIEQEIIAAQEELAQAEAELERTQSPQAAEAWARQNGWARPDEGLVVMVPPSAEGSPDAEGGAGEGAGPTSPRDAWWELFFGSR